jgi:flavin-dependent dehydrogenase
MKDAVDAAGFHPWLGNTVWWGSTEPRVEEFASAEPGYQVERDRFDEVLRGVAAKAGAEVVSGSVREIGFHVVGDGDRGLQPATIDIEVDGQSLRVTAKIILDCSGRAGVIARRGYRQLEGSHRTIALVGVWRATSPWPRAQRGHTLVASHADGWAWSVPTSDETRYVTVMVDPERSQLARGVSPLDVYRAELKKVRPFGPLLESGTMIEGPWGADASLYSTSQYSGPGFILAGDAASFIDPLSSFGVKKALASGWLAAITANTILKTPAMADEARAFYERRERAVVESFRRQAARYAAITGDATAHPFWEARMDLFGGRVWGPGEFAGPDQPPPRLRRSAGALAKAEGPVSEDPSVLARDPDVLAALDDLRRRPAIDLERGDQVRTGPRAAIRGQLIVMDDHLFLPAWPGGVRYLRNIDLLLLMRLATEHQDVGTLYDAMFREQPGVSLPDFLGALSTMMARGALKHRHP